MIVSIKWEKVKDSDREVITKQLGREPRGLLGIATRCCFGFSQVIVSRPVISEDENIQVFPTTFWLTCPYMRRQVGLLESQGTISEMQKQMLEDEEFSSKMMHTHERYALKRKNLVPEQVLAAMEEKYPKRYKVLTESGVGGIRNRGVKCLHAHLADYLATGDNIIGEKVINMLNLKTHCSSGSCEKERSE